MKWKQENEVTQGFIGIWPEMHNLCVKLVMSASCDTSYFFIPNPGPIAHGIALICPNVSLSVYLSAFNQNYLHLIITGHRHFSYMCASSFRWPHYHCHWPCGLDLAILTLLLPHQMSVTGDKTLHNHIF